MTAVLRIAAAMVVSLVVGAALLLLTPVGDWDRPYRLALFVAIGLATGALMGPTDDAGARRRQP